jgi:hypothetical protein
LAVADAFAAFRLAPAAAHCGALCPLADNTGKNSQHARACRRNLHFIAKENSQLTARPAPS